MKPFEDVEEEDGEEYGGDEGEDVLRRLRWKCGVR